MTYEKPAVVVLGEASQLILGGGDSASSDCCTCKYKSTEQDLGSLGS